MAGPPTLPLPDHPTTASGKRNWAWSAVHPGQPVPSAATLPAQDLSFADAVDVINPLQHIPLISMAYRALTGDQISGSARILGDTLYGGPVGLAAGAANAISAETAGTDIGGRLLAAAFGSASESSTRTLSDASADYLAVSERSAARNLNAPVSRISFDA